MRSVLYIDQKDSDLFLMRRAFEAYGFGSHLHTVPDGEEAIAYLSGGDKYANRALFPLPSLIIVEIKLPGLSGFDLIKWVRSCPPIARTPMVIFTGWELPSDIKLAYMIGANSYVFKSSNPQQFEQQVRQIINFWLEANVTAGKVPVGLEKPPPAPNANGHN